MKMHHSLTARSITRAIGKTPQVLLGACAVVALAACGSGGGGGDDDGPTNDADQFVEGTDQIVDVTDALNCNAGTQKQWAYNAMQDFYLFYDQVPVVDPQSFDSADDLVRSVRFEERDDFSNVTNASVATLQFEAGREFGLGFTVRRDEQGDLRFIEVVPDSPVGRAALERGDIIHSINGLATDDPALSQNFSSTVIGTPDNPLSSIWRIEKRDTGELVDIDMTSAEYAIATVPIAQVYSGDANPSTVGYLHFTRFLETSVVELNDAFEFFDENNINELVVDLRYNGGGRVSVARHLASQIAGESNAGNTIYEYKFNDKYTQRNFTLDFQSGLGDLNLSRVVILTSDGTASSSEIVIAGLQPHLEVVTIGERSRGKPFIQYVYTRCDEQLAVIEAEGFNDAGVSVFGGVAATCFAEDDITRDFGRNPNGEFEGMLQASLDYIATGTCSTAPIAQARSSFYNDGAAEKAIAGYQFMGGALVD